MCVAVAGGFFLNSTETRQKHHAVEQQAEAMESHLLSSMQIKAEVMEAMLAFIIEDRRIIAALESGDRKQLLELATPIYERFNQQNNITHFYFHDGQRVNLLRVHKPEKYGDTINRFTALGAEKSGSLFSGIELGPLGTFTLRSVLPVFGGGRLLGYIELGQEIDGIIEEAHTMFGVELLLLIAKQYLSQSDWEEGMRMLARPFDWRLLTNMVLVSQSLEEAPIVLLNRVDSELVEEIDVHRDVELNDRNYWAAVIPIKDAGERKVGSLIMLHDMTSLNQDSKTEMLWFAALSTLISWIIFLLFYRVLGNTEQELSDARARLIEEGEARTRQVEQALNIQRVLDEMLNISLPPLTMKEVLSKSLDAVLTIPIFTLQQKGAIFFVAEDGKSLEMAAQRNLSEVLLQSCAMLPFGKCLCGRAAATRELVFFDHLNAQHEISYDGIEPHGHYCIPIISEGRLLGVLNAYVDAGHVREAAEEGFLKNVANTLAVVIERKQAEEKLEEMAHHDTLTGLPNRIVLYDRLDQSLALARRHRESFAVVFLDLDHFKEVNDTLGHDAGDQLLIDASTRISGCIREVDTLARVGGDEFCLILMDTRDPAGATVVAEKILKALTTPFDISGQSCQVGTSIGIAIFPADGEDSETLIKNADAAMYRAKRQRNTYCFFNNKG
ncbi:diguanylate cyclase domain-containing protein [Mariprofundus ferrinatatus]|uniref:diguanylate cyclase domain-containing protein n=1 Tax=Mariprofundus ferrinatatus TaxID=1921087 RepID=UPI001E63FEE5|nr:diguanylate cyclase [Mariprofundus ferrinatatus]